MGLKKEILLTAAMINKNSSSSKYQKSNHNRNEILYCFFFISVAVVRVAPLQQTRFAC
jgi:hypothetical protein